MNKLAEKVKQYLSEYPEDAPMFLRAMTDGLEKFKDAQNKTRGALAYRSVDALFMLVYNSKNLKGKEVSFLIDAIMHQFPDGWNSVGSQLHEEAMTDFIKKYEKEGCWGGDWERQVKNAGPYMDALKADKRTIKILEEQNVKT